MKFLVGLPFPRAAQGRKERDTGLGFAHLQLRGYPAATRLSKLALLRGQARIGVEPCQNTLTRICNWLRHDIHLRGTTLTFLHMAFQLLVDFEIAIAFITLSLLKHSLNSDSIALLHSDFTYCYLFQLPALSILYLTF